MSSRPNGPNSLIINTIFIGGSRHKLRNEAIKLRTHPEAHWMGLFVSRFNNNIHVLGPSTVALSVSPGASVVVLLISTGRSNPPQRQC